MHVVSLSFWNMKNLVSAFIALPLGIIFILLELFPSASQVPVHLWVSSYGFALGLAASLVIFAGFRIIVEMHVRSTFFLASSALMASLVGASIAAAIYIDRDFYTAAFQYILAAPMLFMFYIRSGSSKEPFPRNTQLSLSKAGYVLSLFYGQWIFMMGYAIATRAEPRPQQSLVYNLYNLILTLLLFYLSRSLKRESFHTLRIEKSSITVNGSNLESYVGKKKADLVVAFAKAPNRTLRCAEIQKILPDESMPEGEPACEACGEADTKATQCKRYRRTYNDILDIKKLLEFLEIGTITAPENKRRILLEGWKLILFENARIIIRTVPTQDKATQTLYPQ